MVGREVARLPDLVNHGRVDQTVSYDDLSEIIVERPHGLQQDPGLGGFYVWATGRSRGIMPPAQSFWVPPPRQKCVKVF